MARRQAQVVTGARGADVREAKEGDPQSQLAAQARETQKVTRKPGEVVYQSKASNFRVQITAPASIFNPQTGRIEDQRPKAAKFSGGIFRTTDPETIAVIESLRGYGVNRDVWRVEAMTEHRRAEQAREYAFNLQSDPELLAAVRAQLSPEVASFAPPATVNPEEQPEGDIAEA
jgi:hypothetical protein